jgi:hypothetical protein
MRWCIGAESDSKTARTGAGVLKYADGRVYDGEWKDNKYNGRG